MTRESLKLNTRKALATMARRHGIDRWHSMRKAELVDALLHVSSSQGRTAPKSAKRTERSKPLQRSPALPDQKYRVAENGNPLRKSGARPRTPSIFPRAIALTGEKPAIPGIPPARHTQRTAPASPNARSGGRRDLAAADQPDAGTVPVKERLILMVRDPFWLHAHWEISRATMRRAAAALAADWHRAVPVLRLLVISGEGRSSVESSVRDVEIHGGVNHWYLPVDGAQRSYRLQIGYRAPFGKFYVLAKSNVVTTPHPGSPNSVEENWSEVEQNYQRILAISGTHGDASIHSPLREFFNERLQSRTRSRASHANTRSGREVTERLEFDMQVELVIRGSLQPDAQLTLQGIPVALRDDGSFTLRMGLQEGRQMIPAVATSSDGSRQHTILLAVERNTKELESQSPDDA